MDDESLERQLKNLLRGVNNISPQDTSFTRQMKELFSGLESLSPQIETLDLRWSLREQRRRQQEAPEEREPLVTADLYKKLYLEGEKDFSGLKRQVFEQGNAIKSEGRLIDFIMKDPEVDADIKNTLDGTVIISASNVVQFFFEGTDQEEWDTDDFPNCAPVFEDFWLDCNAPGQINSKEQGVTPWPASNPTHWGFHCHGFDLRDKEAREEFLQTTGAYRSEVEAFLQPGIRWAMDMWLFIKMPTILYAPAWLWRIFIDEQGKIIRHAEKKYAYVITGPVHPQIHRFIMRLMTEGLSYDQAKDAVYRSMLLYWHTALLSISFLHCKNVKLDDVTPPKQTVHSHKKKRKGEKPYQPIPYKVLDIFPMKEILRKEGKSGTVGTKKSLHICIWHFKHYENGRGLFAKHKGMYFWHMHARGMKERGVTTKDYTIVLDPKKSKHKGTSSA